MNDDERFVIDQDAPEPAPDDVTRWQKLASDLVLLNCIFGLAVAVLSGCLGHAYCMLWEQEKIARAEKSRADATYQIANMWMHRYVGEIERQRRPNGADDSGPAPAQLQKAFPLDDFPPERLMRKGAER